MDNKRMIIEKLVERRKPERFRAQEGAFVELRDHRGKLGEIIDISKEGLTFRYIDIGDRPKGSFELDIFLKEKGFGLKKLPAKTVSDDETTETFPHSITIMRRRKVQFENLTNSQKYRLKYFIRNYTLGEASTQEEWR
jgi:hypothetical protein